MSEAKTLYAEFTARAGHEEEVERLVAGLSEEARREPGNVTFIAHRLVDAPSAFFVYEEYADAEAFAEHIGSEHGTLFNAELAAHIVEQGSRLTWLDRI